MSFQIVFGFCSQLLMFKVLLPITKNQINPSAQRIKKSNLDRKKKIGIAL